jgi:hypothetical protein
MGRRLIGLAWECCRLGYERYVHRSFAIGIEPYLKISLREIGWPNIKLFSGGAYVTLRYRFMKPQE